MKKTFFPLLLFIISKFAYCESIVPFSKWPQAKPELCGSIIVVVAETYNLACQGFCNASSDDFNRIIIWFPDISGGTKFVNANPGYGTVNSDIKIVFLDKNWRVIDIKTMEKKTGSAIAPEKTYSTIEGIPEIINNLNFKVGEPSPFRIEKRGKRYLIRNNHRGKNENLCFCNVYIFSGCISFFTNNRKRKDTADFEPRCLAYNVNIWW